MNRYSSGRGRGAGGRPQQFQPAAIPNDQAGEAVLGKRPRGARYTSAEIDKLLDLVEEKLPTGSDCWDG